MDVDDSGAPDADFAELEPRQIEALEALWSGANHEEAAQIAGKTSRTIRNWIRKGPFARVYRAGLLRNGELAQNVLRGYQVQAAHVLVACARGDIEAREAAVRIKAACEILDRASAVLAAAPVTDDASISSKIARVYGRPPELGVNDEDVVH